MTQFVITQNISEATDDIFLAQVAALEMVAKGDVSYFDQIPGYIEAAIAAATTARELSVTQRNIDAIGRVISLTEEYRTGVTQCRDFMVASSRLTAETTEIADRADAASRELIDYLRDSYEELEQTGTTLTMVQVRNFGEAIALLEILGQMRVYYRNYQIYISDPKKTVEQANARRMFNEKAAQFERNAASLSETLTLATARENLRRTIELIREKTTKCNQSMDIRVQQATAEVNKTQIANNIEREAKQLNVMLSE
jgi:hypothetical protein